VNAACHKYGQEDADVTGGSPTLTVMQIAMQCAKSNPSFYTSTASGYTFGRFNQLAIDRVKLDSEAVRWPSQTITELVQTAAERLIVAIPFQKTKEEKYVNHQSSRLPSSGSGKHRGSL
jgi:predicted DNA-binding transcriptional regulator AlpA